MSRRFSMREMVPWPTPIAMARSSWVCCAALRRSLSDPTFRERTSIDGVLMSFLVDLPLTCAAPLTGAGIAFLGFLGIRLPNGNYGEGATIYAFKCICNRRHIAGGPESGLPAFYRC